MAKNFSLKEMGSRLKTYRYSLGYGDNMLREFCRKHGGINPSWWGKIEKGQQKLYIDTVGKLCRQFDLSPTWLMFGVGISELSQLERRNGHIKHGAKPPKMPANEPPSAS